MNLPLPPSVIRLEVDLLSADVSNKLAEIGTVCLVGERERERAAQSGWIDVCH